MSGRCIDCRKECPHVMMVGQVEVGSGPGWIIYACPVHARRRAQRVHAPAWLRDDVAELDAEDESGEASESNSDPQLATETLHRDRERATLTIENVLDDVVDEQRDILDRLA